MPRKKLRVKVDEHQVLDSMSDMERNEYINKACDFFVKAKSCYDDGGSVSFKDKSGWNTVIDMS